MASLTTSVTDLTAVAGELAFIMQDVRDSLDAVTESFKKVSAPVAKAAAVVNTSIASIGNTLLSLAKAGLQGTTEGARLSFVWQQFTRQIASVFLPAINALISGLQRLTEWFKGLTGDGQHIAFMIGGVSVAFAVMGPLLSKMLGVLSPTAVAIAMLVEGLMLWLTGTTEGQMVIKGLGDLWSWFTEKVGGFSEVFRVVADAVVVALQGIVRGITFVAIQLSSVIESILDWVPMMGGAVDAMRQWRENAEANLQKMMAEGWGVKGGAVKPADKKQVNPSGFSFESLSASFERITSAANKTDLARETLDIQKAQLQAQLAIAAGVSQGAVRERSPSGDH